MYFFLIFSVEFFENKHSKSIKLINNKVIINNNILINTKPICLE